MRLINFVNGLILLTALNPIIANSQQYLYPPEIILADKNSVDLLTGLGQFSLNAGGVGTKDNGLEYEQYWTSGGRTSNWEIWLKRYIDDTNAQTYVVLMLGGSTIRFRKDFTSGKYIMERGYSTLLEAPDGKSFTYIDKAGNRKIFSDPNNINNGSFCSPSVVDCRLYLTKDIDANGIETYYQWDWVAPFARLKSLENSAGYKASISYASDANPNININGWFVKTRIDFYNKSTNNGSIASILFSTPQQYYEGITTTGGQLWQIYSDAEKVFAIRRPGSTIDAPDYRSNDAPQGMPQCIFPCVRRIVNDNGLITVYDRTVSGTSGVTIITQPNGSISKVYFNEYNSKVFHSASVSQIQDALSRSTYYNIDRLTNLVLDITYPEGNKNIYTYDNRQNLNSAVELAKPNSQLPNRTISSSFPLN